MTPLSNDKLISLYRCLIDICDLLDFTFEDILNVFYCGRGAKWGVPNTLVVVIKNDEANPYAAEMSTTEGCSGAAYVPSLLDKRYGCWDRNNRPAQYRYRVIFERVFNGVASYNVIFEHDWVDDKDPYKQGLCVLEEMQKLDELMAFI